MKLLLLLFIVVAVASCTGSSDGGSTGASAATPLSIPKTTAKAPATKVEPVTDTIHGVAVVDQYRWLEGNNSDPKEPGKLTPEVTAWTDAQNAYTREVLDALPGRKAVEDRLTPLMQVSSVTAPTMRGTRYFFTKREGTQNQPIVYWREGYKGPDKVLLDPNQWDKDGLITIEWISPTEDGKQLAYGTYRAGDENTTLHLVDVDTGKIQTLEIPDKTQQPSWLPDNSGFVYQNLKNPKDPYSGQVMFHRTGSDRAKDPVLFRQFTKAENLKLSTTWGPFGYLSRDGHWLILGYWTDTKSNDLWVVDFDQYRKTGKLDRKDIIVGMSGQSLANVVGKTIYVQTTNGAPKGKVAAADVSTPGKDHWKDVIPERQDAVIQGVSFGKGTIAVTYLKNASNVIEVFDLSGKSLGVINQPGIGASGIAAEEDRNEAYLTFTSFNYPRRSSGWI